MKQLRTVFSVVAIAIFFGVGTYRADSGQVTERRGSENALHLLEITKADVFAKHNWTAEEISVLGFYLGMSKTDAVENARKQDLRLRCLNYCDVCDNQNILCNGIGLGFGSDERIEGIYVMKPLEEAPPDLRRFSVTQQFKGQTYVFFHRYSTDLRLKLFGRESGHEGDGPRVRSTTYLYPSIGLKIYLSLSGNTRITERDADLDVYFAHPKKP
jgi:hypothetical protein